MPSETTVLHAETGLGTDLHGGQDIAALIGYYEAKGRRLRAEALTAGLCSLRRSLSRLPGRVRQRFSSHHGASLTAVCPVAGWLDDTDTVPGYLIERKTAPGS
jgi:hypothetical protein